MGKNKMDALTFGKLFDMFGESAARDTLNDVNEGRISASTVEKYAFADESKEDYSVRLKEEYSDWV